MAYNGEVTTSSDADEAGENETEENSELDAAEFIGGDIEGATELTLWTFQELHLNFYQDAAERWNEEYPHKKLWIKLPK